MLHVGKAADGLELHGGEVLDVVMRYRVDVDLEDLALG